MAVEPATPVGSTDGSPKSDANAGTVFTTFIDRELSEERARRTSLDARGVGVLTTSGTLVTLLFALGSLVSSVQGFKPGALTIWLLGLALIAFITAALLGLLANRLWEYRVVTPRQLHVWRADSKWGDTADKARQALALANIRTIESLRGGNNKKASFIEAALWAQLGAIILLASAIGVTLANAIWP